MQVGKALSLFVCQGAWRLLGIRPAGRVLVHALASKDENIKTIAGMFLVQAGTKSSPLLKDALKHREGLTMALNVVGDIGDPTFESDLHVFAKDSDPEVAQAAKDALLFIESPQ